MRIVGLGRAVAGGEGPRAPTAGGFRIAESAGPGASRAAAPPRAAPALDALIALQAVGQTPRERRRRAVSRGRSLLGALDGLKLAVLEGRTDAETLSGLSRDLVERREATGDQGLDEVLAAIELRAAVELAKRGR
jgi:hypothetical protein